MKTIRRVALTLLLGAGYGHVTAQDSTTRFAFGTTAGQISEGSGQPGGWSVRQQVTYFPTQRVGVALGLNWGSIEQPLTDPASAEQLWRFYVRALNTTDLSVVLRLFDSRRHAIAVQGGGAVLRAKTVHADSVAFLTSPLGAVARYNITEDRTVVPMLGATYQFRFSPRFSAGVEGRWLLTQQPIRTLGLAATYRFNVSAASLGFSPVAVDELTWGLRAGLNLSGPYERGNASYRLAPRALAGVWLQLPLGLNWQLRPELSYVGRGYDRMPPSGRRVIDGSDRSHYVDATLLFSTEIMPNWRALLGPNLGFLLNGQFVTDNQTYPVRPGLNSGLVLGTSVALGRRVALDARYVRDIIQFGSEPYNGYQGFQFGTSIRLGK